MRSCSRTLDAWTWGHVSVANEMRLNRSILFMHVFALLVLISPVHSDWVCIDWCGRVDMSISESFSKFKPLNYHLESLMHKYRFLYVFTLQQFFHILCIL